MKAIKRRKTSPTSADGGLPEQNFPTISSTSYPPSSLHSVAISARRHSHSHMKNAQIIATSNPDPILDSFFNPLFTSSPSLDSNLMGLKNTQTKIPTNFFTTTYSRNGTLQFKILVVFLKQSQITKQHVGSIRFSKNTNINEIFKAIQWFSNCDSTPNSEETQFSFVPKMPQTLTHQAGMDKDIFKIPVFQESHAQLLDQSKSKNSVLIDSDSSLSKPFFSLLELHSSLEQIIEKMKSKQLSGEVSLTLILDLDQELKKNQTKPGNFSFILFY
jgi:hypothetical protein